MTGKELAGIVMAQTSVTTKIRSKRREAVLFILFPFRCSSLMMKMMYTWLIATPIPTAIAQSFYRDYAIQSQRIELERQLSARLSPETIVRWPLLLILVHGLKI